MGEVAHEARVINRTDGANAHGAGGELPKIRHQPRVRVARQTACTRAWPRNFLSVMRQVVGGQSTFQISTRIHTRCAVRLKKHQVATLCGIACFEEMVEAHFKQISSAGITRDVPTQFAIRFVGAHHHGQCVPSHQRTQAFFNRQVARESGLQMRRNGVDIGRHQRWLPRHLRHMRALHHLVQDETRALRSGRRHQRMKSVCPLCGFLGVCVGL